MDRQRPGKFEDFYKLVVHTHHIANTEVTIGYADVHGDLLPINNDDNFCKAVSSANPLLRVFIQKRGTGGRGSWSSSRNEDQGRGSGSSCKNEVRGGGRGSGSSCRNEVRGAWLRVFIQQRGTGGVPRGLRPETRGTVVALARLSSQGDAVLGSVCHHGTLVFPPVVRDERNRHLFCRYLSAKLKNV